ncbi:MAG TPA: hypothetical protein VGO56_04325 [Pyrinomonadaceae bacterium]|jgi:hypothetical protein|nr:hypothetical protein [Pyrinomonadaceae bacterium]
MTEPMDSKVKDLLEKATTLRNNAQDARRRARKETAPDERSRLFDDAALGFQQAIADLERGLRTARRQQDGYNINVCGILEALSQSYGSLGGTWRDAGDLEKAQSFYDTGNEYEGERRINCGAKDTYNMLQRLIIRALRQPALVNDPTFLIEIDEVRAEIKRQNRTDSWALADLALAQFLRGISADQVIADLKRGDAAATFYESTYNAVTALIAEGLGRDGALGDQLESFRRLLQRKGGLP